MTKKLCFLLSLGLMGNVYAATKTEMAHAELKSPSMKSLDAHVQITDSGEELKVVADVTGLKPGSVHGFHIHEKGECKGPDFKSAGGHLNPDKNPHSGPAAGMKHLGDLGNLVANDKGEARTEVVIPKSDTNTLKNVVGKAVIIHSKPDDQMSQPSGDAGDRIACGVVKQDKM